MIEGLIGVLIAVVVILLITALVAYLVRRFVPIDPEPKGWIITAIWVIGVLAVILKLLPLANLG